MMKTFPIVLVLVACCLGVSMAQPAPVAWNPVERASAETVKPKKILFIGNSYTYFNDLDRVLKELAASATPPVKLRIGRVVKGGATLAMHYQNLETLQKIAKVQWDVVVLQEQSTRPVTDPDVFFDSARDFDTIIDQQHAKTALFMTWARQHKPEMTEALDQAYTHAGRQLDAFVAPAGLAWSASLKANPEIPLYDDDKSHPNVHGTYLTACVFYATLTGESPVGLSTAGVKEVTAAKAGKLQEIAWETVQTYAQKQSQRTEVMNSSVDSM